MRMFGGSFGSSDRASSRTLSWRRDGLAVGAMTGWSSRGWATHADRAQTSAQPSLGASANQLSAQPALQRPIANTRDCEAAATVTNACHSAAESNQPAMPPPNRRRSSAETASSRSPGPSPAPRPAAESQVFRQCLACCGRGASPMLGALVHCIAQ
jgi:hypothetical protein